MSVQNDHYSGTARFFHWLTVLMVAVMVPSGIAMVYRGKVLNVWDSVTNTLYESHKLLGVAVLTVVALRILYRLAKGAPAHEPTLTPMMRAISNASHLALYVLLVALPITGWIGISMFPALGAFGIQLPALVAADKAMSAQVFWLHGVLAGMLVIVLAMARWRQHCSTHSSAAMASWPACGSVVGLRVGPVGARSVVCGWPDAIPHRPI